MDDVFYFSIPSCNSCFFCKLSLNFICPSSWSFFIWFPIFESIGLSFFSFCFINSLSNWIIDWNYNFLSWVNPECLSKFICRLISCLYDNFYVVIWNFRLVCSCLWNNVLRKSWRNDCVFSKLVTFIEIIYTIFFLVFILSFFVCWPICES